VTASEEKQLIATFLYQANNNLKCENCASRLEGDRKEKYRKDRGCYGVVENVVAYWQYEGSPDKFNFHTCPTNLKNSYFSNLISLYHEYERGRTIYSSDIMQMPNRFVQFMDIIGSLIYTKNEHERKKRERVNRNGKRS